MIKDDRDYLIFDMDGTLIDSMPSWYESAFMELSKCMQLEHKDTVQEMKKLIWSNYARLTVEQQNEFWPNWYKNMETLYKSVKLKEGVEEFLKLAKEEGKHLAVCTGSPLYLANQVLTDLSIIHYFDFVTSSYGTGRRKSTGIIFDEACKQWNIEPIKVSIYEDTLNNLFIPANKKYRCIGIYDAASEEEQEDLKKMSDIYIHSFKELF